MSDEKSLEESYLLLFRFLMHSKHRVFVIGAQHDLTGMQTMVILLLDCPRPMNAFSKIFNCDASNITGLVDGLEDKSLVSRYEDEQNRRIKTVQLQPAGVKLRKKLLKSFTSTNSPLLSKLDDDELETFVCLLRKMTDGESAA